MLKHVTHMLQDCVFVATAHMNTHSGLCTKARCQHVYTVHTHTHVRDDNPSSDRHELTIIVDVDIDGDDFVCDYFDLRTDLCTTDADTVGGQLVQAHDDIAQRVRQGLLNIGDGDSPPFPDKRPIRINTIDWMEQAGHLATHDSLSKGKAEGGRCSRSKLINTHRQRALMG